MMLGSGMTFILVASLISLLHGSSANTFSTSHLLSTISTQLEVTGGAGGAGGAMFSVEDVKWLLKRLGMNHCGHKEGEHGHEEHGHGEEESSKCTLCVKPEEFLKWYKYDKTTNITDTVFGEYSVGLVYIITEKNPTEKHCEEFTKKVLAMKTTDVGSTVLQKYGGSLEQMAQNVERIYGDQLDKKCFNVSSDVVTHNSTGGIGTDKVTSASLYLVMKLLDCLPYEASEDALSVRKIFKTFQMVYSDVVLQNFTENATKCYTRLDIESTLSHDLDDRPMRSERLIDDITPVVLKLVKNMSVAKHSKDHHHHHHHHKSKRNTDTWEPWIASLISIAVISFGSLIGIIAFRGKQGKYFHHVMCYLVSLGSSVLVCDAILHLVPHSLGFHGELDGSHFNSGSWLWKCLMVLIGIYIFILMELTLSVLGLDHSHGEHDTHEDHNSHEMKVSNGGSEPIEKFSMKSIKSVAWMILIGDGVHNFMDGVAIGGVFSEPFPAGLNGGIMTSIAILIHEVPHELGDFAVLISSGLSVKQALILNLLSSLTAFIGGVVGILLGTHWNASPWIFAITAGLFTYISLVDMLPEVRRNPLLKSSPKLALFLDFCGFSTGLIVMFLLASYESNLTNALMDGEYHFH